MGAPPFCRQTAQAMVQVGMTAFRHLTEAGKPKRMTMSEKASRIEMHVVPCSCPIWGPIFGSVLPSRDVTVMRSDHSETLPETGVLRERSDIEQQNAKS